MSSSPRVSVLMPFLNTRPFIAEAIESVLAQGGSNLWELLLVNDGSSDGSDDVARAYVERYSPRIRLFQHEGGRSRGIAASHNLAMQHACGDYLAILDSDDVWLPDTLPRRVALLDGCGAAGMVYGNTEFWYSWAGGPQKAGRDYMPDLGLPSGALMAPGVLLPLFLSRRAAVPCTCSTLVRRELAERLGGFEESLRIYVDQAFYAKVVLASPVMAVDECWARYRRHPASSCSVIRAAGQERERALAFLAWLEQYLADEHVDSPAIRQAITRVRWRLRHPLVTRRVTRARVLM